MRFKQISPHHLHVSTLVVPRGSGREGQRGGGNQEGAADEELTNEASNLTSNKAGHVWVQRS